MLLKMFKCVFLNISEWIYAKFKNEAGNFDDTIIMVTSINISRNLFDEWEQNYRS